MTIIERIQAIVGAMTTGVTSPKVWTFYSMSEEELNRNDSPIFPYAHLSRPERVSGTFKYGYFVNTYALRMFFTGALVALPENQDSRDSMLSTVRIAVNEFLMLVAASGPMNIVEYNITEVFNWLDSNVDGWTLTFKVKINEAACI